MDTLLLTASAAFGLPLSHGIGTGLSPLLGATLALVTASVLLMGRDALASPSFATVDRSGSPRSAT